jgi:hypothetical protein
MDFIGQFLFYASALVVVIGLIGLVQPMPSIGLERRSDGFLTCAAATAVCALGMQMSPELQADFEASKARSAAEARLSQEAAEREARDPAKRSGKHEILVGMWCSETAKRGRKFPETFSQIGAPAQSMDQRTGVWTVSVLFTSKSPVGLDVPARAHCTITPDGNVNARLSQG